MNNQHKILICITGGIAAYKIPALVRLIKKNNCECKIIMTSSAENFVSPMVLATLSENKIWHDKDLLSEDYGSGIPHIKLSEWADLIVIAPCSANTLAKISNGIADNLLTSTVIAAKCPVLIFPAMNSNMYENYFTQKNLLNLKNAGYKLIEPDSGELACGTSGKGRMPEPEIIMLEILRALEKNILSGKKILITAGPTLEYLDPVRFISNPSTGKMGIAMARAAWMKGAEIKLIAGPVDSSLNFYGFDVIKIISARDMLQAVLNNLSWADYIVKAAAVGDYRAENISGKKIKRENKNNIQINLIQNPDIASEVGKLKRDDQILIGFAAETDELINNARKKLLSKNLNYILVNDVLEKNSGFGTDTNTLKLISRDENFPEQNFTGLKIDIASQIWNVIASR